MKHMHVDNHPTLICDKMRMLYCCGAGFGWVLLRLVAGLSLVPHGWNKIFLDGRMENFIGTVGELGFIWPTFFAWGATLTELVGGVLIAIGLLTRPAAAAAVFLMTVITFGPHWENGFLGEHGMEHPALWLVVLLYIFFRGGSYWSVDRILGREF